MSPLNFENTFFPLPMTIAVNGMTTVPERDIEVVNNQFRSGEPLKVHAMLVGASDTKNEFIEVKQVTLELKPPEKFVFNWLSTYTNDNGEVAEFCQKNKILDDVKNTITLVMRSFPKTKSIKLEMIEDRDEDSERVAITTKVQSSVDDAFAAYQLFLKKWVIVTSYAASRKIWLSYSVVCNSESD